MIDLQHIEARFGSFRLRDINLRVPDGGYCVLLGPPGSGKTSVVEVVCGLRAMLGGRVVLNGRSVERADPADRHIGYVPQDYALFPTQDVRGNIAFGLAIRRRPAGEIAARVSQVARRLNIEHLLDRSCGGLSGGERQRVALARALVLEPKVLLLDEPVSALDESTRQRVCLELRRLHDSLGTTTIHISHNFEETRTVADMVGVINNGRLIQVGPVEQVFRNPDTEFVARFVQAGNVVRGIVGRSGTKDAPARPDAPARQTGSAHEGSPIQLEGARINYPGRLPPGPVALLLRAHDATIAPAGQPTPPGHAALPGEVVGVHDNGGFQTTVRVAVSPADMLAIALLKQDNKPPPCRPGDAVQVVFDPTRLRPLIADLPSQQENADAK